MADWTTNTGMLWAGNKISDHGRSPISMSVEKIGTDKRMHDGTLRRHFIKNKRTWSCSWDNIPSRRSIPGGMTTADGGFSGTEMEDFYRTTQGKFRLVIRRGSAINQTVPVPAESALPFEDNNFYITNVMFTEFSKEIKTRGVVDLWSVSVSLEEV